ncbi:hypothetical protein CIHG_09317 [Coccidioides immitis H538.4]|uniref:Uncharacterized protein n=1 Tax=Coccidioides immitis H538.4 TaxID=396776 RepID=A0A0J8UUH1_COCIT|nr:hypothetical protein CIHG_09317 [Coccidioides immitis H538.4]
MGTKRSPLLQESRSSSGGENEGGRLLQAPLEGKTTRTGLASVLPYLRSKAISADEETKTLDHSGSSTTRLVGCKRDKTAHLVHCSVLVAVLGCVDHAVFAVDARGWALRIRAQQLHHNSTRIESSFLSS